jgi:hypothetical protein
MLRRCLGPGRYNPRKVVSANDKKVGGVGFIKTDKRLKYKFEESPGPATYQINRTIVPNRPQNMQRPLSSFAKPYKTPQIREIERQNIKRKYVKKKIYQKYVKTAKNEEEPGPGYYDAEMAKDNLRNYRPMSVGGSRPFENQQVRFLGKKELLGEMVDNPGPGDYEVGSQFERRQFQARQAVF